MKIFSSHEKVSFLFELKLEERKLWNNRRVLMGKTIFHPGISHSTAPTNEKRNEIRTLCILKLIFIYLCHRQQIKSVICSSAGNEFIPCMGSWTQKKKNSEFSKNYVHSDLFDTFDFEWIQSSFYLFHYQLELNMKIFHNKKW